MVGVYIDDFLIFVNNIANVDSKIWGAFCSLPPLAPDIVDEPPENINGCHIDIYKNKA